MLPEVRTDCVSSIDSLPSWPAWAHDDRWSWLLSDGHPLTLATRQYLKENHFQQIRLIDSDLGLYRVSDAQVFWRAGLFGWRPGYRGTYFSVRPAFKLERTLSISDARDYVLDFAAAHPLAFGGASASDEVRAAVLAADSPQKLFLAAR